MCLLRCGVEKALVEDVRQVWRSTGKMAAVVVVMVRSLSCSGMRIAGLLFRGSLLYHSPSHDDLLFGGALLFGDALASGDALTVGDALIVGDALTVGDALPLGDAPLLAGDDLVCDDVPILHNDVSGAPVRTSRVVRAVS